MEKRKEIAWRKRNPPSPKTNSLLWAAARAPVLSALGTFISAAVAFYAVLVVNRLSDQQKMTQLQVEAHRLEQDRQLLGQSRIERDRNRAEAAAALDDAIVLRRETQGLQIQVDGLRAQYGQASRTLSEVSSKLDAGRQELLQVKEDAAGAKAEIVARTRAQQDVVLLDQLDLVAAREENYLDLFVLHEGLQDFEGPRKAAVGVSVMGDWMTLPDEWATRDAFFVDRRALPKVGPEIASPSVLIPFLVDASVQETATRSTKDEASLPSALADDLQRQARSVCNVFRLEASSVPDLTYVKLPGTLVGSTSDEPRACRVTFLSRQPASFARPLLATWAADLTAIYKAVDSTGAGEFSRFDMGRVSSILDSLAMPPSHVTYRRGGTPVSADEFFKADFGSLALPPPRFDATPVQMATRNFDCRKAVSKLGYERVAELIEKRKAQVTREVGSVPTIDKGRLHEDVHAMAAFRDKVLEGVCEESRPSVVIFDEPNNYTTGKMQSYSLAMGTLQTDARSRIARLRDQRLVDSGAIAAQTSSFTTVVAGGCTRDDQNCSGTSK